MVYCLVYVDDMLFAGHSEDVQDAVNIIMNSYDATDEGEARSFLGMGITRDRAKRTLKLSQSAYIDDMAKKFSFDTEHVMDFIRCLKEDQRRLTDNGITISNEDKTHVCLRNV